MLDKSTYNNIPALRFPDFANDGEWEVKRLGDIAEIKTGYPFDSSDFSETGKYLVITNGNIQDFSDKVVDTVGNRIDINDDTVLGQYLLNIDDILVTMDGTVGRCAKVKTNNMILAQRVARIVTKNVDKEFLYQLLKSGGFSKRMMYLAHGGTIKHISLKEISEYQALVPPLPEQQRIAACLSAADEMINATNGKLEQLKAYKKGLMQQLFANPMGGGKSLIINDLQIQKLRFPEFRNEKKWEEKKLGEFLYEHKTKSDGKSQVYSVSVSKGVINQMEYLGRSFAASDTSKYKLVKPFDVVYTKSPTGNFPYGIVKQSMINHNVIVSPLYGVFSPINQYIGYIIHSYFESPERTNNYLVPIVQKGAKNTIQISNETFLSQKVCFPSEYNEQRKIASCLSTMDDQINAYTEKVGLLGQYKKGLMQRMFPQNQMN